MRKKIKTGKDLVVRLTSKYVDKSTSKQISAIGKFISCQLNKLFSSMQLSLFTRFPASLLVIL